MCAENKRKYKRQKVQKEKTKISTEVKGKSVYKGPTPLTFYVNSYVDVVHYFNVNIPLSNHYILMH